MRSLKKFATCKRCFLLWKSLFSDASPPMYDVSKIICVEKIGSRAARKILKIYHWFFMCFLYFLKKFFGLDKIRSRPRGNLCVDKIHFRPHEVLCVGKIGSGRGGGIFEMCVWHDINLQCSAPTSTRPAEQEVASTTQPAKNLRPLAPTNRILTPQDKNHLGKKRTTNYSRNEKNARRGLIGSVVSKFI